MIPNTKVFVGSLPPGARPEELRRLFEKFGVVTECDIMNRCGFVHMQNADMASNAIKALNKTSFKGATLSVEPGRIRDRGSSGKRRGPSGGGGGRDGDRMRGNRSGGGSNFGGGGGGAGPMRRDSKFGSMRNTPYGSSGGGGGSGGSFDRRGGGGMGSSGLQFGGNMGGFGGGNDRFNDRFDNNPMDNYGNSSISDAFGGDRHSGGFSMRNQDRRGFALPERPLFDDMNGPGSGGRGNWDDSRGSGMGGGNMRSMMGNDRGYNFNDSRDGYGSMGGSRDGFGGMGGGSRDGYGSMGGQNMGGLSNFSDDFPPLRSSGMNGNFRMNRDGPSRQSMMQNRRY